MSQGPDLASILAQLQQSSQYQGGSGGPMPGNIGLPASGGGLGASYGAPPQLSQGDLPAVGPHNPTSSQSSASTIHRLQQLAGILKQLGHPAFQGSHLPGLPPGLHVPHAVGHQLPLHPHHQPTGSALGALLAHSHATQY